MGEWVGWDPGAGAAAYEPLEGRAEVRERQVTRCPGRDVLAGSARPGS